MPDISLCLTRSVLPCIGGSNCVGRGFDELGRTHQAGCTVLNEEQRDSETRESLRREVLERKRFDQKLCFYQRRGKQR